MAALTLSPVETNARPVSILHSKKRSSEVLTNADSAHTSPVTRLLAASINIFDDLSVRAC
jgi:hypothetical protein